MKKALIITGIVIVVLFGALLAAPVLFKSQIKTLVVEQANKNLNAEVGFKDFSLSFIRNFPHASIALDSAFVAGKGDFASDTLLKVNRLNVVVDIKSFFSDEGYLINRILIAQPDIYAHILPDGRPNWDIMIPSDTTQVEDTDTTQTAFKLSLQKLEIENANIIYNDEQGKMYASVFDFNHTLSGDLTADSTLLKTTNSIKELTFKMGNIPYVNRAELTLDSEIKANLAELIFTLKETTLKLNAIALQPDGWLKVLDNGYEMDITLGAPETQFKDILSLIPAIYAKDFADIQTKGKVTFNAFAKGVYTAEPEHYPAFGVDLTVSDARFKYPALPKSVDNINIAANVANAGGSLDNTKVDVKRFAFSLGGNPFSGTVKVATPISDPDLDMYAKGKINLGMIKDVYPMDSIGNLSGILDADLKLKGRMSYYEKQQYDKFFFDGKLNISDLVLDTKSLPNKLEIKRANLVFNPKFVALPALEIKVGKTDLSANGRLDNFIPYIFKDETLRGTLQTSSNYLNVADLMSSAAPEPAKAQGQASSEPMTVVVLPDNLDFTLNSTFNKIIFDDINIDNAKGNLRLANSKLTINNLSLNTMGGNIEMSGDYSTKSPTQPLVDMNLNITDVLFTEMFKQVETMRKLTPIFEKTTGRFSAKVKLDATLGNDMMPDLNTLTAKGSLSSRSVGISGVKVMQQLGTALKRDELKNPVLQNISIPFSIVKGRVYTDPFDFNIADTKIRVNKGSTGIDQTIDYTLNVDIPMKETTVLKLNKVGVRLGGTFASPKVSLETKELIDDAKEVLKEQATQKIEQAKEQATQQINEVKEQVKQEAKENLNKELQKTGDELKKGLKDLFKK